MGRGYEIVTRGSPSTCCGDSMEVKPRTSGGAARASSSVAATSHSADVIMLRFASRASAWVLSDGDESGLGHSSRHRLVAVRYPKISSMSRGDCAQRRETEEGGKTPHTTRLTLSSSDSERERERERERTRYLRVSSMLGYTSLGRVAGEGTPTWQRRGMKVVRSAVGGSQTPGNSKNKNRKTPGNSEKNNPTFKGG